MTPEPNETYRGIKIYLSLDETPTEWTGKVEFALGDVDPLLFPPGSLEKTYSKFDPCVAAVQVGADMLVRARAAIDEWYERGNG